MVSADGTISVPRKISHKGMVKKLDDYTREKVRERDNHTCCWCERTNLEGFNSQMSHVVTKGTSTFLRWDMNNVKLLCAYCHNNRWHLQSLGRKWFDDKYPERAEYVDTNRTTRVKTKKFVKELYEEIFNS